MMKLLFSVWLIFLAATPLVAKSVGQAVISQNKDVLEAGEALATNHEDEAKRHRSSLSIPERFLQIAHKSCQGPEGQPGTCMFNFACQQQRGQVVGACLDGFLFGACCHLPVDDSLPPAVSSTVQAIVSTTNSSSDDTIIIDDVSASSSEYDDTKETVVKDRPMDLPVFINLDNLRIPSGTNNRLPVPDQLTQLEMVAQLPLVLMFRNESESAFKIATQSQPEVQQTSVLGSSAEEEQASESTVRVVSSSAPNLNNTVAAPWSSGDDSQLITSLSDNQISHSSSEAKPTTAGSVLLDKGDPDLQEQLSALLHAHTESTVSPYQSLTTVKNRVPVRNKGQPNKRLRPKTTTKPTVTTSSTTPLSTTSTTTSTTSATESLLIKLSQDSAEASNIVVTESLADQQANLLQFLVSNPPAWVLDEIINGSTLTTWYPLPIPEEVPESHPDLASVETVTQSSTISTTAVTRPLKRKPVKNRPALSNRISSTTSASVPETDGQSGVVTTSSSTVIAAVVATGTTENEVTSTTTTRKPRPVFDYTKDCGVRPMAPEARIVGGRRSDYGRWPWQVLIRESTWFGIFSKNKCGGVLISDRHVLTAAHCQPGFLGSLLVVLGEFDLTGHSEPNTPTEKNVKRVVVHRDYVERTFENDLAILELETAVEFKPYIVPVCLPSTSEGDFVGRKAEVTGWGKLSHNGQTPGVLYEVDVPIMSNPECHDMFKKAGHEKRILDSFVCAGYSEGKKDSCEGDSGGPLMVERDDGRWSLVGTVSHGIRCAYPNMPGVYMRMTYYRPWIERVTGIGGTQLGR